MTQIFCATRARLYLLFATLALFIAIWAILWCFSSASLASGFCENRFSLLHQFARCRQPYVALIGFFVFTMGALWGFLKVYAYRKANLSPPCN
jgi:hypothetical protein